MSTESPYCIVLADDHTLFRQEMKRILKGKPNLCVVGEAGDGLELLKLLEAVAPHMVILDVSMPKLGGVKAAREINDHHPEVRVLILTMHKNEEYFSQAISAGAKGYLLKENIDTGLFPAIKTIRDGGVYFPPFHSGISRGY